MAYEDIRAELDAKKKELAELEGKYRILKTEVKQKEFALRLLMGYKNYKRKSPTKKPEISPNP